MLLTRNDAILRQKHPKRRKSLTDISVDKFRAEDQPDPCSLPAINVHEADEAYVLEFAAPGFSKQDVGIHLHENLLRIAFDLEEREEKNYINRQFVLDDGDHTFRLPKDVIQNRITAAFEQGLLTITLPRDLNRQSDEEPTRISIG